MLAFLLVLLKRVAACRNTAKRLLLCACSVRVGPSAGVEGGRLVVAFGSEFELRMAE